MQKNEQKPLKEFVRELWDRLKLEYNTQFNGEIFPPDDLGQYKIVFKLLSGRAATGKGSTGEEAAQNAFDKAIAGEWDEE